ncbi:MAG: hypothetical protein AB1925_12715 [Actinomycetota bacterium]
MTRPQSAQCSRDKCRRVVQNRGLCKYHYPLAYPAHLRGDTDATRAREHIAALRGRGVTVKMLHDDYGLTDSVVHRIERNPSRIRRYTEAQVLAIPLPAVWVPSLADVDATGTQRRLRALAAIGYTQEYIGDRIGTVQRHIANLMIREKVSGATAHRVAKVFDELHMTPGPSEIARRRAALKGWLPPLAWDEGTIDDPAAQPTVVEQQRVLFIDRYLEMVDLGYTDEQIAGKLGYSIETLERMLYQRGYRPRRVVTPAEQAAS